MSASALARHTRSGPRRGASLRVAANVARRWRQRNLRDHPTAAETTSLGGPTQSSGLSTPSTHRAEGGSGAVPSGETSPASSLEGGGRGARGGAREARDSVEGKGGKGGGGKEEFQGPSTLQLGAATAVIALGAKLIMMYDESQEPARVALRARRFAEQQENLPLPTEEEWERMMQVRPLTPFDGPVDRERARIHTGRMPAPRDAWNWALDSLTEALEGSEERRKG